MYACCRADESEEDGWESRASSECGIAELQAEPKSDTAPPKHQGWIVKRNKPGALAVPRRLAERVNEALQVRAADHGSCQTQTSPAASALTPPHAGTSHIETACAWQRSVEERVQAAGMRAHYVIEQERTALDQDRKRAWQDRQHGVRGPERADYHGHVAPAWLGPLCQQTCGPLSLAIVP